MDERSWGRLLRFDETIVPGTERSVLHFALTRRFASTNPTNDILRKLGIMSPDDHGINRLAIAGVLLCTREPQRWLTHAYIQAVSYAGEPTDIEH